jgi:hypothetical protein
MPFIGEYSDEITGAVGAGLESLGVVAEGTGARAMADQRAVQDAMQRQRPGASMAAGIAGGIVAGIPMAGLAAPAAAGMAGATTATNVLRAGAAGIGLGATEGAVSGFGAGSGGAGNRANEALVRGAIGGVIGGVVGAAAPAAGAGAKALWQRFKGRDVSVIAKRLGISDDAAKVVKAALDADDLDAAEAAIKRAGKKSMLADAGPSTQGLLDAAVATGGKGGTVAKRAVDARAVAESKRMDSVLSRILGKPEGVKALETGVRDSTAAARSSVYDAAYSSPINYADPRGQTLESLLKRVPRAAWQRANDLMSLEGEQSRQIMASFADDGTVTLSRMPDVRQIDYLTRALRNVAAEADGAGKMGGTTDLGRATGNLATSIRQTVRGLVPEYAKALDTAADAMSRRDAIILGANAMKQTTTREMVRDATRGMSLAERQAAKQGLRSYVDDTLANARSALGRETEISEALKLVRDMDSRAAKEKLVLLLGPRDATRLAKEMAQVAQSLETRQAIAMNSKTAVRSAIHGRTKDIVTPSGPIDQAMRGKAPDAVASVIQALTGKTPEADALRLQGIFDEIAQALVTVRGPDAQRALSIVKTAMRGQPVTDAQADFVGRLVTGGVATSGYPLATQGTASLRE